MSTTPRGRAIRMRLVAAGALAALALTGCSAGGTAAPTTSTSDGPSAGGSLVAALAGDPTTMDSGVNSGSLTIAVGSQIFEQLFALDKTFTPQPMLVDEYTLSDDGLVYTFALREDVPFHDGSALDAGDVVASLERWMQVSSNGIEEGSRVASVEASDDLTVTLTLTSPSYSLIGSLANVVQGAIILPSEIVEEVGTDLMTDDQLVGTGPYEFVSYAPGQNVKLTRFDDYATRTEEDLGGGAGKKNAYLDDIEFVFVTDNAQRLNGLRTGQWQWVQAIAADDIEGASQDPALTVVSSSTHLMPTLLLNHNAEAATADLRVREALNAVIDKEALAMSTMGPDFLWKLTPGLVGENNAAMYSDVGEEVFSTYDPDAAQALFEEAGVTEVRILSTQTYTQFYDSAVYLQAALAEIGVTATIDIFDFPTMIERLSSEPSGWDISMTRFSGLVTSPTQVLPLTSTWPGEFRSDEIDQLMAAYQGSTSAEEAYGYVEDIQAVVYEEMPFVILGDQGTVGVYSSSLSFPDDFTGSLYNAWLTD